MNSQYLDKRIEVRMDNEKLIFSLDENMILWESGEHIPYCESADLLEQIAAWYPDAESIEVRAAF